MKRILTATALAALLGAAALLPAASAHAQVMTVSIDTPEFGIRVGAPPVFVAPTPVYLPPPVIYAPARVHVPPPVFVPVPVYRPAPVHYYPAPRYLPPHHSHWRGDRHDRHGWHDRRNDRRDFRHERRDDRYDHRHDSRHDGRRDISDVKYGYKYRY